MNNQFGATKLKAWELLKQSQDTDLSVRRDSQLGSNLGDGDPRMKVEDQLRNATFTESQIDHYVHSINSRAFCMSSHNQSRISSQRSSII